MKSWNWKWIYRRVVITQFGYSIQAWSFDKQKWIHIGWEQSNES